MDQNNLLQFEKEANALLNDILSKPYGDELFSTANNLYMLREISDLLTEEELLLMAHRVADASQHSATPLLTAERTDAVRYLLSFGVSESRAEEFDLPQATPGQMKEFLLTCQDEVFTEIVDTTALQNQAYYGPDNDFSIVAAAEHREAFEALQSFCGKSCSLDSRIANAQQRSEFGPSEPEIGPAHDAASR